MLHHRHVSDTVDRVHAAAPRARRAHTCTAMLDLNHHYANVSLLQAPFDTEYLKCEWYLSPGAAFDNLD